MNLCKNCLENNDIKINCLGNPKKDLCEICLNFTYSYTVDTKFIKNLVIKINNNTVAEKLMHTRNQFLYSKQVQNNLDDNDK